MRMLFGDVKAIESVEQREAVALRQQLRLPILPGRLPRPRRHRLGHDHFGTETLEVAASEHVGLGALHVNLEEVDLADALRLAQGGERHDWQLEAR